MVPQRSGVTWKTEEGKTVCQVVSYSVVLFYDKQSHTRAHKYLLTHLTLSGL